MSAELTRREWLELMSVAGASSLIRPGSSESGPIATPPPGSPIPILPLTSSSEVIIPPRGASFNQFSFDFPEPSVEFKGLRFGFRVFTRENVYGLDQSAMKAEQDGDSATIRCDRLIWAGGQQRAEGRLTARLRSSESGIEWDVTAETTQPIKAITTVVRGLPKARLSVSGGAVFDAKDDELLYGYPFGAGDLFGGNTAQSLSTPFLSFVPGTGPVLSIHCVDDKVRAKRFYLQPGETSYRLEAIFEVEGWLNQKGVITPTWRLFRTETIEQATTQHYQQLATSYRIPDRETRPDAPSWLKSIKLVMSLHGMHYTGFVFNDFARMLEILSWTSERIPGEQVLVFLPAWDGRYYWDYPGYEVARRLGGEDGFKRLVDQGHQLGFRFMPMFGANAANRKHPAFAKLAPGITQRLDGGAMPLDWVDWDNDRHQEAWLAYMNLGVKEWREWLTGRIGRTIDRFGVDAYFLDITGGWINNPAADMHAGLCEMVEQLRSRYPRVLACGEFHYDALLSCLPLFHVPSKAASRFCYFFSHLSHPAPGRGSSGVHEAGFGRFDQRTLGLRDGTIPTLSVVENTFSSERATMEAIIHAAKAR